MKTLAYAALFLTALASAKAYNETHINYYYPNQTGVIIPRKAQAEYTRLCTGFRKGFRKLKLAIGKSVHLWSPGNIGDHRAINCGWIIKATDDSIIDITCEVFNLYPAHRNGVCKYKFLRLDGIRFCGTKSVSTTVTGGKSMKIRFYTRSKSHGEGFRCLANALAPATSCDCGKANRARIVGGSETEVNEYPWQAALVNNGSSRVECGGTPINKRFVLSAAHCTGRLLYREMATQVLLGNHLQNKKDTAEKRVNVKRIIQNSHYKYTTKENDFSLVELSKDLDLSALAPAIMPACLPRGTPTSQYDSVDAIVSGWGMLSTGGRIPNALQEVTVQTMNNTACYWKYGGLIKSSMLCAGGDGKDACQGDSGGPLVTEDGGFFYLIGVVSFGGTTCADSNYPGVYSRVTSMLYWIKSITRAGGVCVPSK